MAEPASVITLTDSTANPAPLGLLGFGMTTVLLNIHNAGFSGMDTMILAMGVFIGGIAQVIAGVMEWKKKNTFGTAAFTLYGFFWLSLVGLLVFPKMGLGDAPSAFAMGCYLTVWGVFTAVMFVGTLKLSRALRVVFGSLAALFFLLAFSDFSGSGGVKIFAGYEGVFCGLSAMYAALAQILNEVYGKTVLPL
ncbi:MAG: acetate uptake transporter [Elusimicrobia bacterium]|nr:acetate uptake transporter [Elusimicrobiota bacterium]